MGWCNIGLGVLGVLGDFRVCDCGDCGLEILFACTGLLGFAVVGVGLVRWFWVRGLIGLARCEFDYVGFVLVVWYRLVWWPGDGFGWFSGLLVQELWRWF